MMDKQTAIVFGATGGIGKAISETLRLSDYNLGLSSLSIDTISSDSIFARQVDIRNLERVNEFVFKVLERFKKIDVVVISVGKPTTAFIQDMESEDFDNAISLYVKGLFNVVKAILPIMVSQKSGYIINIGALRGLKGSAQKAAYCSTKASAAMFMDVLREEVKDFGIQVSTINPGFTDTLFYKSDSKRPFLCRDNGLLEKIPITKPLDIAKAVSFLLSLSEGAIVRELNIGKIFNFGKPEIVGLMKCLQNKK